MTYHTEPGHTLGPEDMPLAPFADLERDLRAQAINQADTARDAIARGDMTGAAVRYENALTRFHVAAALGDAVRRAAAIIADTHEQRIHEGQLIQPGITQAEVEQWFDRDSHGTVRYEHPQPGEPGSMLGRDDQEPLPGEALPGNRFGEGGAPE